MAVGGAEDKIRKRTVLMEFVRRAGGDAARIVMVPAASAEPDERGALYAGIFNELGAAGQDSPPATAGGSAIRQVNFKTAEAAGTGTGEAHHGAPDAHAGLSGHDHVR